MKIWTILSLSLALVGPGFADESPVFNYQDVVNRAEDLSKQPFTPQVQELSEDLQKLDYDLFFRIRFLTEHAVWPGLPYRLGFFHPGSYLKRRVVMHAIEPGRLRDIPFSPAYFHYDRPLVFSGHEDFAGFKVFAPSGRTGIQDEFLSFLGTSYFRAIGRGMHWGLSARGIAVNTGVSTPEEFPDFREFWVRQPLPNDTSLQFYALLDGPSLTGGYEFTVRYGDVTTMDIRATLFVRKKPEVLTLAPIISMFYFGENTVNKPTLRPDYQGKSRTELSMNSTEFLRRESRPQVHDSDGLLMTTTSGEKLWAPLDNPKSVELRRFSDVTSYSFLQRDRDASHYLDREAEYERRPNLQVIPQSGFENGYVRLLQIPAKDEYTDNMVAAWEVPNLPDAGGRLEFAYRLVWSTLEPDLDQFRVLSTTVRPSPQSNETRFTIEFGKPEKQETIPVAELRPHVVVNQNGQVRDVQFTPTDRGWLVSFTIFNPNPGPTSMDISCVILRRDNFTSEKWQYLLNT
ncbi:MAG: glucan biosynthesis protein [Verrucomicrobia bacterium]|nr:glucan biosynthesis protein [Verrucomicrobiota bacterium]MBV8483256.1 glucan biosynthesis protein [Verrucomicrobiota bacterium]